MSAKKPVIGIPADRRMIGAHPFHAVGEKYLTALLEAADAVPLIIPALTSRFQLSEVLDRFDGILLTGSPSMLQPHFYGGEPSEAGTWHDSHRDDLTMTLIARALEAGLPLLGICRGFQEMNVASGGSLWPKLQEVPGHLDHRDDPQQPLEVQYGPAHEVVLEPGGVLRRLAGTDRITVNSLHTQGVRTLGQGLAVEARAPDGVVEAFRVASAPAFALAVQWHPEWQVGGNPFSRALFAEFGAAARAVK
jgi:putative glutamine amidotransferase